MRQNRRDQIAERYIGRQIETSGSDLNAASSETLQQLAAEITAEYNKELNPGPTQELFTTPLPITAGMKRSPRMPRVAAINNAGDRGDSPGGSSSKLTTHARIANWVTKD